MVVSTNARKSWLETGWGFLSPARAIKTPRRGQPRRGVFFLSAFDSLRSLCRCVESANAGNEKLGGFYIIPGIPPIPPGIPPGAPPPPFSSGISAIMASVVSSRLATLAAF